VELDNLNLIRAGNVNNAQSQASGIKPRSLPVATPIFRWIDANPVICSSKTMQWQPPLRLVILQKAGGIS
jgi:hypothetical protein